MGEERALDRELLAAAERCDLDAIAQLLAQGASARYVHDPEGTWGSRDKKTALHLAACQAGSAKPWRACVIALLEAGADPQVLKESSDWRGCGATTSVLELLGAQLHDAELLQLLLAKGADPNQAFVRHVHSMRTDGSASRTLVTDASAEGPLGVLAALLRAGGDANARAECKMDNERGFDRDSSEACLHLAIAAGDVAKVRLLLDAGADPTAVRRELRQEATHAASPTDDPRDGRFVASVRCVPCAEPALHQACRLGHREIAQLLLCRGADPGAGRLPAGPVSGRPYGRSRFDGAAWPHCRDLAAWLSELRPGWQPATHRYFAQPVQRRLEALAMVAHRKLPRAGPLERICAFAAQA